ncbi:unnamed protein product [Microthlaspi erraticum]|uniref:Uncharacterized protein n=1 Tax=Microthlaspi erraticum TaxID=1685480 RepID=A0A6D2LHI3_9BRAS|nr:unnamed protein product [Microthlaspi erraticum]
MPCKESIGDLLMSVAYGRVLDVTALVLGDLIGPELIILQRAWSSVAGTHISVSSPRSVKVMYPIPSLLSSAAASWDAS